MVTLFQTMLMCLSVCGLAASLLLLMLRSRSTRDAFARIYSVWRSLTAFGRVAVCLFLLVGVLVGGDKTNSVSNLPPQMMSPMVLQRPGLLLTGLSVNGNLINTMNLVQSQATCAERKSENWNARGAWKDSFWLDFEDGWVFPWGTNHLSGVEVISSGQAWASPFDTNAVATVGAPFEIVPGLTTFTYEFTPSNSYRFIWTDAAINRDTNDLMTASIELMRCGDVAVTTNGVTWTIPRELPFAHDGFGQDAEWVSANFTNATEIVQQGYPAWVDAQVGEGLTNGLYKLTVTVPDEPPETAMLAIGDLSIAVTNAGEYVFLLGKCVDYPIATFPTLTNLVFTAVDDLPGDGANLLSSSVVQPDMMDGWWTEDAQRFAVHYTALSGWIPVADSCMWRSSLYVTPATWQPTESAPDETFTAVVVDCPPQMTPTYAWNASDSISIASPNAASSAITCLYPDVYNGPNALSLDVWLGDACLHVDYLRRTEYGAWPGAALSLSMPETLFANNDDDNDDGVADRLSLPLWHDDDVARGGIAFSSAQATNGTIAVERIEGLAGGFAANAGDTGLYGDSGGSEIVEEGAEYVLSEATDFRKSLFLNPSAASPSYLAGRVKVRWMPETGAAITATRRFTVVEPEAEPICSETTNVVSDGVAHEYVLNPCGVGVGKVAYFTIKVTPADYPDEKIVWDKSGGIAFVDGCGTGRSVAVRGVSEGVASLSVQIGDAVSDRPTFTFNVVSNRVVNLHAWIVSNGDNPSRTADEVRQIVRGAGDIYAQVGVTLNLIEPVIVTNLPSAYDVFYGASSSDIWDFNQLVDIASNTDGLECYFVNEFISDSPVREIIGLNNGQGLAIAKTGDAVTLAHEIGHAFGMRDVYAQTPSGVMLPEHVKPCYSNMPHDWNGGCIGHDSAGVRYYARGTSQQMIIRRMLMDGCKKDETDGRCITFGSVHGLGRAGSGYVQTDVATGFFYDADGDNDYNPTHD